MQYATNAVEIRRWNFLDRRKDAAVGRGERTGSLIRPPDVLLRAVVTLQAKHLMEKPGLAEYLSEMALRLSRLGPASTLLGIENDQLFQADYNHFTTDGTCMNFLRFYPDLSPRLRRIIGNYGGSGRRKV